MPTRVSRLALPSLIWIAAARSCAPALMIGSVISGPYRESGSDMVRPSISIVDANRPAASWAAVRASRLALMFPVAAWAWISLTPSIIFSALAVLVPVVMVPPLVLPGCADCAAGREGRAGGPPFPFAGGAVGVMRGWGSAVTVTPAAVNRWARVRGGAAALVLRASRSLTRICRRSVQPCASICGTVGPALRGAAGERAARVRIAGVRGPAHARPR